MRMSTMSECKIYFADIDDWRIGSTFAEKLSNEIEDDFAAAVVTEEAQTVNHPPHTQDKPIVSLCREKYENSLTVREYMLRLFRQHSLHHNHREIMLAEEDQLIVIQLCLAELNKQITGEYDVEMSKVIEMNKKVLEIRLGLSEADPCDETFNCLLSSYETFLLTNNLFDCADLHERIIKECEQNQMLQDTISETCYLLLQKPADIIEEVLVKCLAKKKDVVKVSAELSLNDSLCITELNLTCSTLDELLPTIGQPPLISNTPFLTAKSGKQLSVSEVYVERMFLSYLHLLVNTRSELALARVINTPNRDLCPKAFDAIKKHAKARNMPMYQSMVSYLMRLRLGGKSYAPDPNSPLAQHVKGLGDFTDLMNKLQTLVEEDPITISAVRRVLSVLKNLIVKCQGMKIRRETVENVANRLQDQAACLIENKQQQHVPSPKEPGRGGSQVGRHTIRILRCILDYYSTQPTHISVANTLSDAYSSQSTPIRFPCLLSQFRSPLEASPGSKESQSLVERLRLKEQAKIKKPIVKRFGACMDWAVPLHDVGMNREENIGTSMKECIQRKTIEVKPTFADRLLESCDDQENVANQPSDQKVVAEHVREKSGVKRPADGLSLSQPSKKIKKTVKSKVVKKKSQQVQKGQKQLTAFFRV